MCIFRTVFCVVAISEISCFLQTVTGEISYLLVRNVLIC